MRILCTIILFLPVFVFAKLTCPMRILPDFCNDKADSRCTFQDGLFLNAPFHVENHPSKPRDIRMDITLQRDHFKIMNLTWKPPNDSSISYLLSYEIYAQRNKFIYNLTQARLTTKDSEIVFSFACKVPRRRHFFICLYSQPTVYCLDDTKTIVKTTISAYNSTTPVFKLTTEPSNASNTSNVSKLWYIFFILSIFVFTLTIFAIFLLKDIFCKQSTHVLENALEVINTRNSISFDDQFSDEEDGYV